jgi:hypothetical protein
MGSQVSPRIITPEVQQAKQSLLNALRKSIEESDASYDHAEAQLSSLLSGTWNEASTYARRLLTGRGRRSQR